MVLNSSVYRNYLNSPATSKKAWYTTIRLAEKKLRSLTSSQNTLESTEQAKEPPLPPVPEDRSPLERFRRPPRKALSVTDLVSPAWCELQFYYALIEPKRKKTTAAMKKGTAIHQALEDEVHMTVAVETTSKEDKFGLRVWNMIQGLRTLRETGRTREFGIWGSIGGEIVTGIIDELTCHRPSSGQESTLQAAISQPTGDQKSLTEYFRSDQASSIETVAGSMAKTTEPEKEVYIKDIKTRVKPVLPDAASMKPTIVQLHLYHQLLHDLILGNFQLSQLADRYELDVAATFSDAFIAQLSSLNQDFSDATTSTQDENLALQLTSSQDSIDLILSHNNLSSLWDHMMSELQTMFIRDENIDASNTNISSHDAIMSQYSHQQQQQQQQQQPPKVRLSPLLTAEYLTSSTPERNSLTIGSDNNHKRKLGIKQFGFNPAFLQNYLRDNLEFWHGQRPAKGVPVEDAWKCRFCDFKEDCAWIKQRDEEGLKEALERQRMRSVAGID